MFRTYNSLTKFVDCEEEKYDFKFILFLSYRKKSMLFRNMFTTIYDGHAFNLIDIFIFTWLCAVLVKCFFSVHHSKCFISFKSESFVLKRRTKEVSYRTLFDSDKGNATHLFNVKLPTGRDILLCHFKDKYEYNHVDNTLSNFVWVIKGGSIH